MDITFADKALREYMEWQEIDRKTVKKINTLIRSIKRDGVMKGLGHPEPLKWRKGYSREIDKKNRLVYEVDENKGVRISSCKGHYDDK